MNKRTLTEFLSRHLRLISATITLFFVPLCLYGQETKTERFDFPQGAVLHLNNSDGELTIQGWDRPEVEITTIKAKHAYRSDDRYPPVLARIQVTTERVGNELVVNTKFPRSHFDLEYRISAPRDAGVVIDHNAGEVHIDNLTGDIRVKVRKGEISLRLPEENTYSIDAKTGSGSLVADFPGRWHRRLWLLGNGTKRRTQLLTDCICEWGTETLQS
jgi:hypothetical protein